LTALASEEDDQLNLFKNYKAIESLLSGRRWLFSAIVKEIPEMIFHHVNWNHYCGAFIDENGIVDYARDNHHPGRAHHEKMAKAYWDKLEQLGWLEALAGLSLKDA